MTVTVAMLGGLVACGSASNESSAEPAPASSEAAQTTAEEGAAGETADEAAQASDSGVILSLIHISIGFPGEIERVVGGQKWRTGAFGYRRKGDSWEYPSQLVTIF